MVPLSGRNRSESAKPFRSAAQHWRRVFLADSSRRGCHLSIMSDTDLLRDFVEARSERAFTELVRRRVDFVYGTALRQLAGDRHRAEDITQEVFIALARKASSLLRHPELLGWLYTTTHFAAVNTIRREQRCRRREEEVLAMTDSTDSALSPANWAHLRPVLDAAMHELSERDRQIVLLRYFDRQSFATIAATLGLTDNGGRKKLRCRRRSVAGGWSNGNQGISAAHAAGA
jgi:RNA polymerase sigma factor (sigma-70 family)